MFAQRVGGANANGTKVSGEEMEDWCLEFISEPLISDLTSSRMGGTAK